MIQLRIDSVHERRVERTRNQLKITSRARSRLSAGGHETKRSGRLYIWHPIVVNAGPLETCRSSSAHSEKVLVWCGRVRPLSCTPAIKPDGRAPNGAFIQPGTDRQIS